MAEGDECAETIDGQGSEGIFVVTARVLFHCLQLCCAARAQCDRSTPVSWVLEEGPGRMFCLLVYVPLEKAPVWC